MKTRVTLWAQKYYDRQKTKVGSCKYSDISTFSFHPLKSITTGEGGMVTTSNNLFYQKLKLLRNHGIFRKKTSQKKYYWSYKVLMPGYNYRISDINCALGYSQLKKLIILLLKEKKLQRIIQKNSKTFQIYLKFLLIKIPLDQHGIFILLILILKN